MTSYSEAEDYLEHYGVLGMKWGVRKDRRKADLQRKLGTKAAENAASNRKAAKRAGGEIKKLQSHKTREAAMEEYRKQYLVDRANQLMFKGYDYRSAQFNASIEASFKTHYDAIKDYASVKAEASTYGAEWTRRNKKIMSMTLSEVKARDIKRAYRGR